MKLTDRPNRVSSHSLNRTATSSPQYLLHFQCYNLTIPSSLTTIRRYTRDGRHPRASVLDDIVNSNDNELGGYSGYNEYNNAAVATHVLRPKCEYSFYLVHWSWLPHTVWSTGRRKATGKVCKIPGLYSCSEPCVHIAHGGGRKTSRNTITDQRTDSPRN